ncbi:MAG TPA: hypothetical protein VMT82_06305 [candidate division Zixibacteria bacterium]|nr:hypothetical protein [candidate division Zixibacteria bacterium]
MVRLLADIGFVMMVASAIIRAVSRFQCLRALAMRTGERPGWFAPDRELLARHEQAAGRTPAWYALRWSRHGIMLGVLIFAAAFAVLL